MNFSTFSKTELYEANIHELRKAGKLVGVRAPCSLCKEDLVDEIYAIITGSKDAYVRKDRRGRPSKNGSYLSIATQLSDLSSGIGVARVASPVDENYQKTGAVGFVPKKGIFIAHNEAGEIKKYPYVDSADDARIGPAFIRDYALRDFDVVEYSTINDSVSKPEVGLVISVNGRPITNEEIYFNRLEKKECSSTVNVTANGASLSINKGGRNLVLAPVSQKDTSVGDAIFEGLTNNKNNYVIKLNIAKEKIGTVEHENSKVFSNLIIDNFKKTENDINKAFLEAKINVSNGKNVYVIIDDFSSLETGVEFYNNDAMSIDLKRNLFAAGAYESGGTLTIICLVNENYQGSTTFFTKVLEFKN